MSIPLIARQAAKPYTLPAGVPTTIDLPINGAESWCALVKNTGANDVTAGTAARNPTGAEGDFEDAVAIPLADLPAAGATMPVTGEHAPVVVLRLVLTATADTTVTVSLGGN